MTTDALFTTPAWALAYPNGVTDTLSAGKTHCRRPMPDRGVLRGLAGQAVTITEITTEADWVGIYSCLLAYLGVHLGRGPHVTVGPTRHPLLIWPLLIGRTGTGRKGEANSTARRIMHAVDPVFMQDNVVSGLSTGEGLIHRLRDDEEKHFGIEDKRLVAEEPEFSSIMARSRREGSTLAQVLRDAWEGRTLQTLTKAAPEKATNPHLSVMAHITPKELRMRLAEADLAGGTYNRFLPICVERVRKLPLPPPVDEQELTEVGRRLKTALLRARAVRDVPLAEDVERIWDGLYDELTLSDDDDDRADEFTRRAAPYCRRIAALHTVMDGRQSTNADDLIAAAGLVRYSIDSAKHALDGMSVNPRLDRIRRAVTEAGPDGLTRTEISTTLFSRNLPKEAIDQLLEQLVEDTCFEQVEVQTGGRPAHRYRRPQTRPTCETK